MPAADERALVDRCQKGDHGAFRVLVEAHMRQAYDLAFSFVQSHDDADDVAQEAFVKAYRSISTFRADAGFSTWLYRIVTNLALDKLRQRQRTARRRVPLSDPMVAQISNSTDAAVNGDLQRQIEQALHTLPTLQRAVVILRHMDGLSTKQVSGILNCSEGTVKTHLYRGLRKMQKLLHHIEEPG